MAPSADSFVLLSRAPCDLGPHVLAGCLYFPKPSRAHLSGESFFVRCDLALYIYHRFLQQFIIVHFLTRFSSLFISMLWPKELD